MSQFEIHTIESAPEGSKEALKQAKGAFGFVPNLIGALGATPIGAKAYLTLNQIFSEATLTPVEQQVVLIAGSVENNCEYCVAAHTGAAKGAEISEDVLSALRAGEKLPDAKLDALATFTKQVIQERGWVSDDQVQTFLDAGYTKAQVIEVIVGLALKTISNYTNHIVDTPLDQQMKQFEWSKPAGATA